MPPAWRPWRCTPRWPARPRAGAHRLAGVLDRLPPSGRAGQGDHGDRPALRWPRRHGHRRRLGGRRVQGVRHPVPRPSRSAWTRPKEGIQCLRGLLHDEVTNFHGEYFNLTEARNEPRPIQAKIPIWVGGGGEKRTLKIAAKYADALERPVRRAGRRSPPSATCCTGTAPTSAATRPRSAARSTPGWRSAQESLEQQFGALAPHGRARRCLKGSDEEIVDRIGQYVEAGADQVNIALRAPFDLDALERFSAALKLG